MEMPFKLIIEALLFASGKRLSVSEIHSIIPDKSIPEIKQAIQELLTEYNSKKRSFVLKEIAGGYEFRSRPEYAPYVLKMLKRSPARLSQAALETLAIIAYKQPILRQEIERLRGVDAGGILRTLLEKGLIRIVGRKNLPGKPLIYGTAKRFLEVFDLESLTSLPKLKEIKELGIQEKGQLLFDEKNAAKENRLRHETSATSPET
jgi:segregation and condensation protein B